MTDVDLYLARQERYRCERLSANLTTAQCEANRRRTGEQVIFSCIDCTGLEVTEVPSSKVGKCSACQRHMKLVSKGMCSRCYQVSYRMGQHALKGRIEAMGPVAEEAAVVVPAVDPADKLGRFLGPPAPLMTLVLDFSHDKELYRRVINAGITEDDILGLLSMLVDNQLRRVA